MHRNSLAYQRSSRTGTSQTVLIGLVVGALLAALLPSAVQSAAHADEHDFSDIAESVHRDNILDISAEGIVQGYPDGTFRPSLSITRGQLATILAGAAGLDAADGDYDFSDIDGNTHAGNIQALADEGVVSGRDDGTFGPDLPVRRDQAASIFARWLDVDEIADGPFTDVPADNVHAGNINALADLGIIVGRTETSFDPAGNVERGQAATLVARAMDEVTVAQYNMLDVRTEDLKRDDNPRLQELAATIQEIEPDIILLNEIAYDDARAHDVAAGDEEGQNAARFVENYLSESQGEGLEPLEYDDFMAPSNTGVHSGHDLNENGLNLLAADGDADYEGDGDYDVPYDDFEQYEAEACGVPSPGEDGTPGEQLQCGRDWGDDSFGFGTFPGQYAMGLLVHPDIDILEDEVRTFQEFLWADMPDALLPSDPDDPDFDPDNPDEGPGDWYSEEELDVFRLSSKSHWDVPVELSDGTVVHLLASHPTPPGFDGPEARNRLRNHDEIRFWGDYLDNADYIYDDDGVTGGLDDDASFVIMGDLNADDDPGGDQDSDTFGDPIGDFLLSKDRVSDEFVPEALEPGTVGEGDEVTDLKDDATADFGIRADYVLPSTDLKIQRGFVYGHSGLFQGGAYGDSPSDHYPVVIELRNPTTTP